MRARVISILLVLAFAAAVGHVAWTTLLGPPQPPRHFVAFDGTAFAAPEPEAKNLYLRRVVAIPQQPRHAWLEVGTRDRLRVYVNGELVGGGDRDGLPVAAVVDLAPHFQKGLNVVAITARQASAGYPPVVALRGEVVLGSSQPQLIEPDAQWRAATRFEHGWLSPDFDDRQWPAPSFTTTSIRAAVAIPPEALTTPPAGSWITPQMSAGGRSALRRAFRLDARPGRAWLRLSSTSPYRLAVNGVVVDDRDEGVGLDEPVAPRRRTYDITTFLRRGTNLVALSVTQAAVPARVHADLGMEDTDGDQVLLGTDAAWLSRSGPPVDWMDRNADTSDWIPSRVETGDLGFVPWSMGHEHIETRFPLSAAARRLAGWLSLTLFVAALTWLACRHAERRLGHVAYVGLVMPTVFLAGATLLTYDPRVSPDAVLNPWTLMLALAAVALQWLLTGNEWHLGGWRTPRWLHTSTVATSLFAGLVVVAVTLRFAGLRAEPLQWDEVEHYEYTQGFLERGFPSRTVHPDLPIAYVHTSELMFVPSALAAIVFDDPRVVMRLAAALWSILSVALLYIAGRRMFTTSVGLIAATLLALSPVAIAMATVGRYFAQLQFFTLLVTYALWRTVNGGAAIDRKWLAVTAAAFVGMYLTWEGSAFLAIGLALAALLHRRTNLRAILLEPAVWITIACVLAVMLLQYSHTVLQQTQFLWYGTSLSDLRVRPMWHYPTFRPWYYIWASSWSLDTLLPIGALIVAIGLSAHHALRRPLRFVLTVYLTTCVFMATLLPAVAWRYVHHLLPLLILAASVSVVALSAALLRLVRETSPRGRMLAHAAGSCAAVAFVAFTTVGPDLREMNRFTVEGFAGKPFKFPNLEGPSKYLRAHLRPGDVVLATDPFQVKHFIRMEGPSFEPQFFWPASTLQLSATLDDTRPVALDRRDGTPAISDLASLRSLFAQHERIWYVVQPERHENQNLPEISAFLRQHMEVAYEDFEAVVLMRDRNHRPAGLRQEEERALRFGKRHRTNFPPEPRLSGS